MGSVPSHATADELASHIREGLSLAAGWCRHKSNAERFRFLRGKSSDAGLMVMVRFSGRLIQRTPFGRA